MSKVADWPLYKPVLKNNTKIVITGINDTNAFDSNLHDIVVMTDGWLDGPIAAILRGGVNAKAVLDVLSCSGVKDLQVFHIEEKIPQLEEIFLSTVVAAASHLFDNANISWRHDHSVFDLVENIGQQYNMLFFGAPLAKSEIQPFYKQLKQLYSGNLAIVRGPMADVEFAESDEIFKWVKNRTFDAADFSFPSVLRNYKKKLQLNIAVMLPALNEEKTVGKVIAAALEVKQAGLIDEVILIDSDSSDNTVPIALSYGIPVFSHPQIRPELGSFRGKGEAMFKSAFVSNADILAWVDTDIENITPSFFYGLLGPLLAYPEIKFVKGYFARPVRVETSGVELGGGRVTEILARPWINTYLPELSGYIQPLAGTVAIYRDLLRKMKIPTNYGVEIAMLIQAVQLGKLWSTCQVNLGEVVHKSKDVIGLSEMAFQILQVLDSMNNITQNNITQNNITQNKEINNNLRRVFKTHNHFEIGIKRFNTHWREYK